MKWYYLERPARVILLRTFYAASFFAYPAFVLLNLEHYKPQQLDDVQALSVAQAVLNPRGPPKQ